MMSMIWGSVYRLILVQYKFWFCLLLFILLSLVTVSTTLAFTVICEQASEEPEFFSFALVRSLHSPNFFSCLAWRLFAGYLHGHRRRCPRMCHPEEQLHGPSRSTKTDYIFYSPNNYHRYNSLSDWSTSPTITAEQIIDRVDSFLLWAYVGVRCYSYEPNILCDNTLFKKITKVTFGRITDPSTIWTLILTVV